jgi:hypothetical protein
MASTVPRQVHSDIIRHTNSVPVHEVIDRVHEFLPEQIRCEAHTTVDLFGVLKSARDSIAPMPPLPPAPSRNARKERKKAWSEECKKLSKDRARALKAILTHYDTAADREDFGTVCMIASRSYGWLSEPKYMTYRMVPLEELASFLELNAPSDSVRAAVKAINWTSLIDRVRAHWRAKVEQDMVPINNLKRKLDALLTAVDETPVEQREWKRARKVEGEEKVVGEQ